MKSLLQPDLIVQHLFDISPMLLREQGIQGIIFDLDNTIIAWDGKELECEIAQWLYFLKDEGFQLYIVSNSLKRRVRAIAAELAIAYTARAGKPFGGGFRDALHDFGLEAEQVAVVGDQLFTDVFGGNRIGAFTILVNPLGKNEFFTTKLTRIVENMILDRSKR